ncbi:MAG: DUF829 domain-containing protein [Balneolaceae bacterium]|nr:MAG: DUF829 domain-containing protein [Balneolaceae bacterium]
MFATLRFGIFGSQPYNGSVNYSWISMHQCVFCHVFSIVSLTYIPHSACTRNIESSVMPTSATVFDSSPSRSAILSSARFFV